MLTITKSVKIASKKNPTDVWEICPLPENESSFNFYNFCDRRDTFRMITLGEYPLGLQNIPSSTQTVALVEKGSLWIANIDFTISWRNKH